MGSPETRGADYTGRLVRLEKARWKRILDVQAPYRWHIRRLFRDRSVLDLGCGIGRNLEHLSPNAIGIDHNEHSIEICRERGLIAFTNAEFAETEYAQHGRFGGMLVAHVIEHMTRAEAVQLLSEYLVYLAPSALVVLICPQERGYATDHTHVEFYDFDALADLSVEVGLTAVGRSSFPFPRTAGRVFPHNQFVVCATKL